MNNISEGNWLVEVAGIPGTFQTKTGGDTEVEHVTERDAGKYDRNVYQGPPITGDLTVGRGYQVPRDQDIRNTLIQRMQSGHRWETTITARPLDEANGVLGKPQVFQAVLKRIGNPEKNANSAQPSRFELTFTVVAVR